jgi:hypothetical protein
MAKQADAKRGRKKGGFKRNLYSTVLVLLILYIGVHVVSRTEGARAAVADKISNGARLPVAIAECGATPLLGLKLKGLTFQGVEMPEVKISFNFLSFISKTKPFISQLKIQGLEVRLKRASVSGSWEPLVLHGIGSRLGAVLGLNPVQHASGDALPKFPDYLINAKTVLQLRRAKILWADEQGKELAFVTEADLNVRTASFTKRKVIQTIVQCGIVQLASGQVLRDFRLEAFRIEGSPIVTVLDMADSAGSYDEFATETLWQDLNLHLNQLTAIR